MYGATIASTSTLLNAPQRSLLKSSHQLAVKTVCTIDNNNDNTKTITSATTDLPRTYGHVAATEDGEGG